jgi:hypothetical protein
MKIDSCTKREKRERKRKRETLRSRWAIGGRAVCIACTPRHTARQMRMTGRGSE